MMVDSRICLKCGRECKEPCTALETINEMFLDPRLREKAEIIRSMRKELAVTDYGVADDLKVLGEKVIQAMPELSIIRDFDIRIGYVRSHESKRDKGKLVNADCRKVSGTYTAYLPFDFIITFYEPNVYYMTENQKKILMLHELRHIGIGERGFRIENHDVEDFKDILSRFGIEWNGLDQDVPDILAAVKVGGDVAKRKGNKK